MLPATSDLRPPTVLRPAASSRLWRLSGLPSSTALALIAGVLWPISPAEAQYFPSHRIVEIPVFGPDPTNIGFSEALGINETGEVVGRATVGPAHSIVHAFVWLPVARPDWRLPGSPTLGMAAGMHDLTEAIRQISGFTLATDGAALDINVHGQIVGEQVVAPGVEAQAFMWDLAGLYTPTAQVIVPSVDGLPSRAWDINDGYLDAVVAAERDVDACGLENHGRGEALRVLLGSPTASITVLAQSGPDARESLAARAVNTPPAGQPARIVGTGDLCGQLQPCGSDFDAVWWGPSPGGGQKLAEGLPALATAQGINDSGGDGEIVGYGQFVDPDVGGCVLHAWYWSSPGASPHYDLHTGAQPPLSAVRSFAEEISNPDPCGRTHIAGWTELPGHAALWRRLESGGAWLHLNLNASSAGLLCEWGPIVQALDVNSSGMVVGWGDRNASPGVLATRGFVLLTTDCIADVTGEGNVDGADLGLLLSD